MQIQPVGFNGKLSKGKTEFTRTSLKEQTVLRAVENFRKNFNKNNLNPILPKQNDLAEYLSYAVSIKNIVKNKANEIFGNVRRSLGV